jgi:DNA polymerase III epsilon subunit-like protein
MKNKTIFLDLETTSLNPLMGEVVEIAIVDEAGRCFLSTRYNIDESLRLQSSKETDAALEYNKLSRKELALYRSIDKFDLSTIEAILNSSDLVIAHNAEFDKAFLEKTSERILGYNCFQSLKWDCSMAKLAKARGIKSGRIKLPNMQLDSVPHSALSDAQNCRLLYQSLQEPSKNSWGNF